MTESLTLPDKAHLMKEGTELITAARDHECTNDASMQTCMKFFAFCKARKKEVQADIDKDLTPQINLLHKLHRQACDLRTKLLLPYEQAESIIEAIMRPYARKKADEAEAERRRKQQEADGKAKQAQQMALLEAELNEATEEVAILKEMPPVTAEVKAEAIAEKVDGAEIRRPWKWEIEIVSEIPREYFMIDTKKIDAEVREKKGGCKIPGIRVFQDVTFAG